MSVNDDDDDDVTDGGLPRTVVRAAPAMHRRQPKQTNNNRTNRLRTAICDETDKTEIYCVITAGGSSTGGSSEQLSRDLTLPSNRPCQYCLMRTIARTNALLNDIKVSVRLPKYTLRHILIFGKGQSADLMMGSEYDNIITALSRICQRKFNVNVNLCSA